MLFGGLPQFVECVFMVSDFTNFLTECDNWVQATIESMIEADCGNEQLANQMFHFWNGPRNQFWLEMFFQQNRHVIITHLGRRIGNFQGLDYNVGGTHSVLAEIN